MHRIEQAMLAMPRQNFLPSQQQPYANQDRPLSIGFGQTNSQPYTVRLMLEWLNPQPNNKVLDVGAGSGWTSAILSELVKPRGSIIAVEKVPELVAFGSQNCKRLGIKNVSFYQATKTYGWPEAAPYDRILVSASASELPQELLDQLRAPGIMVIPVGNSIFDIHKNQEGKIEISEHPGFVFVPLVS